jgi:hypothetical protein
MMQAKRAATVFAVPVPINKAVMTQEPSRARQKAA